MKKEKERIKYTERPLTDEERAQELAGEFEGHTMGEWYDSCLRLEAQGKLISEIDPDGSRRWWTPDQYSEQPLNLN
jgi:hypothetical protein